MIPNDPGHKVPGYQKALSGQHSFIAENQSTFTKELRNSFYSGMYKQFEDYQHTCMNYIKEGPGPQTRNMRESNDPLCSFKPKKITSRKSGFALDKRYLGQENSNYANPAPNAYSQDSSLVNQNLKTSNVVFNKEPNNIDFQRYASGMEEFTIKGLH